MKPLQPPPPRPRLCLVGPMVGRTPGFVTTQGEILTDLFRAGGYPVISTSAYPSRYARFFDKLATIVRHRNDFDLMMIQTFSGLSFVIQDLASWLCCWFGKPLLFHLRGGAIPEFMARNPGWYGRVFRRGDLLVAPSAYLARAIERFGFRARVIPNVIDLSGYPYRHRPVVRPRLFWMRNFHPIYNPQMAVRVLASLRRTHPEATLVMGGGDKGLRAATERLAKDLGVGSAVRFTGFLNRGQKLAEGEGADVFVCTNRIDNMPVAVIEACALGLPVVSTNVGGLPDLLTNQVNGLLVNDDDHEAMAAAIRRLLVEPGLAARLSANGRALAQQSAWDQIRPQWDSLITALVARQPVRLSAPALASYASGPEAGAPF